VGPLPQLLHLIAGHVSSLMVLWEHPCAVAQHIWVGGRVHVSRPEVHYMEALFEVARRCCSPVLL